CPRIGKACWLQRLGVARRGFRRPLSCTPGHVRYQVTVPVGKLPIRGAVRGALSGSGAEVSATEIREPFPADTSGVGAFRYVPLMLVYWPACTSGLPRAAPMR